VSLKDNTFIQLLLLHERAHDAADRIYQAIVAADHGAKTLKPILRPYDTVGSTRYVDFDTTRPTYKTRADRCHVSHVVADTESWEQKLAQTLEEMDEIVAYVKNDHLGFTIPYTLNGEERSYYPDFIARIRFPRDQESVDFLRDSPSRRRQEDGGSSGRAESSFLLNETNSDTARAEALEARSSSLSTAPPGEGEGVLDLIIEVTGEKKKDKAAKAATARTLWVPAVNNHGGFGCWAFVEITDPWDAQDAIRTAVATGCAAGQNGGEEKTR
jgi:type III restriction enzyme